jgi:hypothetical protein
VRLCDWILTWLPFIFGFGFSLFPGQLAAAAVVRPLYALANGDQHNPSAKILGLVERCIYTISIYIQRPEFIGAWLVLKVAGQWGKRSDKAGRAWFNPFLIGTGISLIYGAVGGYLISWIEGRDWQHAFTVPLTLIGASIWLMLYARGVGQSDVRSS